MILNKREFTIFNVDVFLCNSDKITLQSFTFPVHLCQNIVKDSNIFQCSILSAFRSGIENTLETILIKFVFTPMTSPHHRDWISYQQSLGPGHYKNLYEIVFNMNDLFSL